MMPTMSNRARRTAFVLIVCLLAGLSGRTVFTQATIARTPSIISSETLFGFQMGADKKMAKESPKISSPANRTTRLAGNCAPTDHSNGK